MSGSFALSPDGRKLVMGAVNNETGAVSLWMRELGSTTPVRLRGSDGGTLPFWSPAGTEIAFFAEGKLKKTDLQGSSPQVLCSAPQPRGGAWGAGGTIVFAGSFRTGLETVNAAGGTPTSLTTLDEARHEKSHRWPVFLPGGTHLLFLAQTAEATSKDDNSTIEVLALATGARTRVLSANSSPLYSPDGYLLFWREGALRAQAFDVRNHTVSGSVFPLAADVAFDGNEQALASVSDTGILVYSTAVAVSRTDLAIVDRGGRRLQTIAESVLIEGGIALSHDATRLAASVTAEGGRDTDVWIYDLAKRTGAPLTFDEGGERLPLWSWDDQHVLYINDRKNDGVVFRRFADGRGQPELIASNAQGFFVSSVSRDAASIIVTTGAGVTGFDLWRHDIGTKKLTPLVQTSSSDASGALAPNERWLAYQSEETGRWEIWVRSLASEDERWRISSLGGTTPIWRQDGRELYYQTPQGHIMAVSIEPGEDFRASSPRELFRALFSTAGSVNRDYRSYAPFPDGQRFVVDVMKERSPALLTLVTHWTQSARSK
jgi:Tol biopolymer transport system component